MSDEEITPGESSFDALARGVGDGSLSRRRALALIGSSIFGGTLGSLVLADDAAGKKKRRRRKKKKKKNDPPPNPAPLGVTTTCQNLGTACGLGGNTAICQCRLSKEGTQTCMNVINPPNGAQFQNCQQTVNCPAGQICDASAGVCATTCQTA